MSNSKIKAGDLVAVLHEETDTWHHHRVTSDPYRVNQDDLMRLLRVNVTIEGRETYLYFNQIYNSWCLYDK